MLPADEAPKEIPLGPDVAALDDPGALNADAGAPNENTEGALSDFSASAPNPALASLVFFSPTEEAAVPAAGTPNSDAPLYTPVVGAATPNDAEKADTLEEAVAATAPELAAPKIETELEAIAREELLAAGNGMEKAAVAGVFSDGDCAKAELENAGTAVDVAGAELARLKREPAEDAAAVVIPKDIAGAVVFACEVDEPKLKPDDDTGWEGTLKLPAPVAAIGGFVVPKFDVGAWAGDDSKPIDVVG